MAAETRQGCIDRQGTGFFNLRDSWLQAADLGADLVVVVSLGAGIMTEFGSVARCVGASRYSNLTVFWGFLDSTQKTDRCTSNY